MARVRRRQATTEEREAVRKARKQKRLEQKQLRQRMAAMQLPAPPISGPCPFFTPIPNSPDGGPSTAPSSDGGSSTAPSSDGGPSSTASSDGGPSSTPGSDGVPSTTPSSDGGPSTIPSEEEDEAMIATPGDDDSVSSQDSESDERGVSRRSRQNLRRALRRAMRVDTQGSDSPLRSRYRTVHVYTPLPGTPRLSTPLPGTPPRSREDNAEQNLNEGFAVCWDLDFAEIVLGSDPAVACLVCLGEDFGEQGRCAFCKAIIGCITCIDDWTRRRQRDGAAPTCPSCRHVWRGERMEGPDAPAGRRLCRLLIRLLSLSRSLSPSPLPPSFSLVFLLALPLSPFSPMFSQSTWCPFRTDRSSLPYPY